VFVFAQNNLAVKRVQLEKLEGEHVDVPSVLAQFHLQGCHCYDPNEEHKIRSIIKECGEGSFESNIRELGNKISSARTHTKATLTGVVANEQQMTSRMDA
jgi:DNA-binding NtrC family response regulator